MNKWKCNTWVDDFKEKDNEQQTPFERGLKLYKEKSFKIIENLNNINFPKKNEQLRLISTKNFNTAAFIKFISEYEIIEEAILIIFTLNKYAARIIIDLYNQRKIKKINCLISSIRNAGNEIKSQSIRMLIDNIGNDFKLFMCNSHAKIISLRTEKENYYTVEGSGNMSENGRVEQYVFDNDENLFNFTKNWIEEIKILYKNKADLKIFK